MIRLETLAAIITRDDIVTFFSILVSIIVALLAVPYAERWQRRRRSGEDYQYGLHLLQALQYLEEHGSESEQERGGYPWKKVLKEATERINSSTDSPDYRQTDKEHCRQLREACFCLFQREGVLPADRDRLATNRELMERNAWAQIEQQSWRISAVGSKTLRRAMERESKDEQYAAFERFYRSGEIPSPRAGEEHGHHHHEYLEHVLPSPVQGTSDHRTVNGDFVVRADDERTVGFLVRARVNLEEREETTFRFAECPLDESEPQVVTKAQEIREKVDKAWPSDGLATSRPQAHKILAFIVNYRSMETTKISQYDLPALHYLAWTRCRDDIVRVWTSGADESALSFAVPDPLTEARDFLEEYGHGSYDEEAAAFNRSYPKDIVEEVEIIMNNEDLDDKQRCEELCGLRKDRYLDRISLPSIQSSIRSEHVEMDSWIAFLPPLTSM